MFQESDNTKQLLIEDFKRYSKLHSWYKHAKPNDEFIFLQKQGQQERNSIHKNLTDPCPTNIHWHFYKLNNCSKQFLDELIATKQPIYVAKLGPFMCNEGFGIICMDNDNMDYLFKTYSEYKTLLQMFQDDRLYRFKVYSNPIICDIFIREQQKYLDEVLQMNLFLT